MELADMTVYQWAEAYPVGTRVYYWPMARDMPPRLGRVGSGPWLIGTETWVAKVMGDSGKPDTIHLDWILRAPEDA